MLIRKAFVGMVLALAGTGAAVAADGVQFLVTEGQGTGGSREFAVDIYSDGSVTAFQLDLNAAGIEKSGLSLAKCQAGSGKSSGMNVSCNFVEGVLRFSGVNFELEPLSKGWHNLGTFKVKSLAKSGFSAGKLMALDKDGTKLETGFRFEPVQ